MKPVFLLLAIAFCLLTAVPSLAQPARLAAKPNVLFLFADDMRTDTIAAHGNPHIKTPHLDSLVRSGFSFHRNTTG
jgi:arylsulfatase A-like enzyme